MANRHIHRRSWSAARAPFFFTLTLFLAYGAAVGRFPALNFAEKIEDCVAGADLILHLTEWKEYRELDPAAIKKLVKQAKILDGRNMLDRDKWRAAGWDFHALGRA